MIRKSLLLALTIGLGLTTTSYANSTQQPAEQPVVQKIDIQNPVTKSPLEERIEMLERSIVPTTPEATVTAFAKAVQSRNGAVQYALFSPETRIGMTKQMKNSHWVTGVSSPWVETYQIVSQTEKNKEREYIVEFYLATSSGKAGKDQTCLTVEKVGEQWFITSLGPVSEKSIGIWNTHESVEDVDFEKDLKNMKTYNSKLGYKVQLPIEIMNKLTIKDTTCQNEEGNPPCTFFYIRQVTELNLKEMTASDFKNVELISGKTKEKLFSLDDIPKQPIKNNNIRLGSLVWDQQHGQVIFSVQEMADETKTLASETNLSAVALWIYDKKNNTFIFLDRIDSLNGQKNIGIAGMSLRPDGKYLSIDVYIENQPSEPNVLIYDLTQKRQSTQLDHTVSFFWQEEHFVIQRKDKHQSMLYNFDPKTNEITFQ